MKLDTRQASTTTQHYSLMSLMYGHQFDREPDFSEEQAPLLQQELASHIEDFCDCV